MGGIVLCLTGDVMTGRGVDQILPSAGDPRLWERYVDDARTYVELAKAAAAFGPPVVGFDLAGPEAEYPAPPHAAAFLEAGLVDKLLVFTAPRISGDGPGMLEGLPRPLELTRMEARPIGGDVLIQAYLNEP